MDWMGWIGRKGKWMELYCKLIRLGLKGRMCVCMDIFLDRDDAEWGDFAALLLMLQSEAIQRSYTCPHKVLCELPRSRIIVVSYQVWSFCRLYTS